MCREYSDSGLVDGLRRERCEVRDGHDLFHSDGFGTLTVYPVTRISTGRMMSAAMNDAERQMEEVEVLARVVGLRMDVKRLEHLAAAMEGATRMIEMLERLEIEPTDLALDPFDPSWPETSSR